VYAPAERAVTLPLFHLYPWPIYSVVPSLLAFIAALCFKQNLVYYFVDGYFLTTSTTIYYEGRLMPEIEEHINNRADLVKNATFCVFIL
jgi:hypothetical protein